MTEASTTPARSLRAYVICMGGLPVRGFARCLPVIAIVGFSVLAGVLFLVVGLWHSLLLLVVVAAWMWDLADSDQQRWWTCRPSQDAGMIAWAVAIPVYVDMVMNAFHLPLGLRLAAIVGIACPLTWVTVRSRRAARQRRDEWIEHRISNAVHWSIRPDCISIMHPDWETAREAEQARVDALRADLTADWMAVSLPLDRRVALIDARIAPSEALAPDTVALSNEDLVTMRALEDYAANGRRSLFDGPDRT